MLFNSIRWRLQLWHGLLLVSVLAGFGVTAYQLQRANQLRSIDQELQQRVAMIAGPMAAGRPPGRPPLDGGLPEHFRPERGPGGLTPPERPGDNLGPPRDFRLPPRILNLFENSGDFYYIVWLRDGTVLKRSSNTPEDVDRPLRPNSDAAQPARMRGTFRESYQFVPPGESILVGRSVATELAQMHRLAWWLVVAGGAVLVLGLAGGWWLATRAIRPIDDISATAVKIAGGDLSRRISAAETDNELGRLAGVLNSAFARLEAAFGQQARFTADASHELRTPVSVILAQTQTALGRERSAAEYRETVEACQRAAQRMRQLIESLLELARLDAGQEPMRRERFDLSHTARECVELVRPLAADRGVQIHCDLPVVECLGDADRLGQVVTNLLSNAVHFNHERGEVRISVHAENGTAILAVTDTGQGIPPEDLPHVFERFFRVDKSRSRTQGRTGLGLAICKAIMDAHGGSIEASSHLGKGSAFVIRLPAS